MTTTLDGRESLYQYLSGFDAGDVGAAVVYAGNQEFVPGTFEPAGTASGLMATHLSALNPHNQYLLASSFNPAAFDPAGSAASAASGAASALASHVAAANPHTVYLLSAAYTAADVLAKLLTVDGASSGLDADLLDGLSSLAFVKADGSVTGATSQAQTFINSIIATAGMRPAADTTAYKWLTKADGTTAVVSANTVSNRIILAGSISVGAVGRGLTVGDGDTNHSIIFINSGIEFTAFNNSIFRFKDAVTTRTIEIRPASELISLPTIEITTGAVRGKEVGGAAGGDITVRGGHSTTAPVFSGGNGGNLILSGGQHTDNSAGHQGTVGDIIFKGYTPGATATLQEIGRWKGDTGLLNVVGTVQADGLRIDATPTAETPAATHTVIINLNGTNYKFLCVPA